MWGVGNTLTTRRLRSILAALFLGSWHFIKLNTSRTTEKHKNKRETNYTYTRLLELATTKEKTTRTVRPKTFLAVWRWRCNIHHWNKLLQPKRGRSCTLLLISQFWEREVPALLLLNCCWTSHHLDPPLILYPWIPDSLELISPAACQ